METPQYTSIPPLIYALTACMDLCVKQYRNEHIDVNEHSIQRDDRTHKVFCIYKTVPWIERISSCINLANTIYEIKKSFIGFKKVYNKY